MACCKLWNGVMMIFAFFLQTTIILDRKKSCFVAMK